MDNAHNHRPDRAVSAREAELLAVMEQSDRDVASGQIVPMDEVLAELDEVIEEIDAGRRARSA